MLASLQAKQFTGVIAEHARGIASPRTVAFLLNVRSRWASPAALATVTGQVL